MISRRKFLHQAPLAGLLGALQARSLTKRSAGAPGEMAPGSFIDAAPGNGVTFLHQAPHSPRKYLLETMGSGVALFDSNNNGLLDIYLINGAPFGDYVAPGTILEKTGPQYWNRLYRQKPDGRFEDATEKAGLQGVGYGMGAAAADYDNDGHTDLFVTSWGGNHVYHNNGDGTFTDVTEKTGVGGSGWSSSAAWVDLNNNGYLDLVVLRYVEWNWNDVWCGSPTNRGYCHPDVFQPITMLVYRNNGDGTFTEEAHKVGLAKPGKALGIAIADYDRDGHPDIFIANDSMVEFLFHNKGDGTFEETGLMAGVAVDGNGRTFAGMGVDFSDYDNDGWPDLMIGDLANQIYPLYRNNGDGSFTYASYISGVAATTLLHSGWGLRFMDYDNDGWKDLLIAQGHDLDTIHRTFPDLHYREAPLLLRNIKGRKFVNVGPLSGDIFHARWAGRGLAMGDIDNDGRLDAVITENGGPAHVLMNRTKTANHWIRFRLAGHKSNRDGIGAVIRVDTAQGSQWYTVTTASSYLSSGDVRAHFGLGSETIAKTVEVRWPSGIVQTLKNVRGDQQIQVDEPVAATEKRW
jgi:hypothetical protein